MTEQTSESFWKLFHQLPPAVQHAARKAHRLWLNDDKHPSLEFKELHPGLWSVRINLQYRALGRRRGNVLTWFWIGVHSEYDRHIKRP